jgi:hypothetical protein
LLGKDRFRSTAFRTINPVRLINYCFGTELNFAKRLWMNQRQQIFNEYLKIKNLLNTSNKLKNEQTFLRFEVAENEIGLRSLYAKIPDSQRLLLVEEVYFEQWVSCLGAEFGAFPTFMIGLLEKYEDIKYLEKIIFDDFFNKEFGRLFSF